MGFTHFFKQYQNQFRIRYMSGFITLSIRYFLRLFIVSCFFPVMMQFDTLHAQGNTVIRYTAEEGVCGSLLHYITRDKQGRIWVGAYGPDLSVFDGRSWKCFKVSSPGISSFYSDKQGNVWINYHDKQVAHIVDAQIQFIQFPHGSSYKFFILDGDPYCIDDSTFSIYKFKYSSNQFLKVDSKNLKSDLGGFTVIECRPVGKAVVIVFKNKKDRIKIFNLDWNRNFSLLEVTDEVHRGTRYYSSDFQSYIVDFGAKILMNKHGVMNQLPIPMKENFIGEKVKYNAQIFKITRDACTGHLYLFWKVSKEKRFILQEYNQELALINQIVYCSNLEPFGCTKDYAGNYWLATESYIQKILAYQYIIDRNNSDIPNQIWAVTEAQDGMMWFGSYGQGLWRFDGDLVLTQPRELDRIGAAKYDDMATIDPNGNLLFNLENAYNKDIGTRFGPGITRVSPDNHIEYIPTKNAAFFWGNNRSGNLMRGMCCHQGLHIYHNPKALSDEAVSFSIDGSKGLKLTNVLTAIEDKYNRYWMAMPSQGISMYDPKTDTVINWLISDNKNNIGSISIDQDFMGNLWFGSDDGLYFFNNIRDIKQGFPLKKHLRRMGEEYIGTTGVLTVKLIDSSNLLVGNRVGYYLLDLASYYKTNGAVRFHGIFNIKNRNYTGGTIGQNAAWVARDGSFWMTTSEGIVRHLSNKYISSTSSEAVTIDSLCVGHYCLTATDLDESISLKSHQNSISIYFHHEIDSLLGENTFFRYRINNNKWSPLFKESFVSFQNLSPGKYTFEIKTVKNGYESAIKSVSFSVSQPLLRNWRFWLPVTLSVFGFGLYLYGRQRMIYRQNLSLSKKESEVKLMSKEKDILHIQAIVNQLNPHFINNALQWLQVRVDDDPEAVKLIAKLSENISTVFRNSRNKINYHTLESEMNLTSNYLFIQKCRFGERLSQVLPEKAEWESVSKYNIPMLMIQIHVENAIEHGIRNKDDGRGTVTIEIHEQASYVQVLIKDDGVGRAAAAVLGSKGTQNGTKMLAEIQQILNKKNRLKLSQTYHDGIYTDEKGEKYGTCVEILIPKLFDFQI